MNLLGEPSLDKIDPKKETPAQQCALAMLNALQATLNGFEEKKSRIIIADVTDTPLH